MSHFALTCMPISVSSQFRAHWLYLFNSKLLSHLLYIECWYTNHNSFSLVFPKMCNCSLGVKDMNSIQLFCSPLRLQHHRSFPPFPAHKHKNNSEPLECEEPNCWFFTLFIHYYSLLYRMWWICCVVIAPCWTPPRRAISAESRNLSGMGDCGILNCLKLILQVRKRNKYVGSGSGHNSDPNPTRTQKLKKFYFSWKTLKSYLNCKSSKNINQHLLYKPVVESVQE